MRLPGLGRKTRIKFLNLRKTVWSGYHLLKIHENQIVIWELFFGKFFGTRFNIIERKKEKDGGMTTKQKKIGVFERGYAKSNTITKIEQVENIPPIYRAIEIDINIALENVEYRVVSSLSLEEKKEYSVHIYDRSHISGVSFISLF